MDRVFLVVLGMSVTATVVIFAVLLLRLCLRRAPKKISYILWLAVAFRLCCPVSVPFALSLFRLPVLETAAEPGRIAEVLSAREPEGQELPEKLPEAFGLSQGNADAPISSPSAEQSPAAPAEIAGPYGTIPSALGPQSAATEQTAPDAAELPASSLPENPSDLVSETPIPSASASEQTEAPSPADPSAAAEPDLISEPADTEREGAGRASGSAKTLRWLRALTVVWIAGASLFLLYGIAGALVLRRMLASAVWLEDNVWQSDKMRSPFLFGLIRPRIYVPFGLEEDCLLYVLDHERYHIRYRDDLVKAAAFAILAVHWFNPLVWLAFHLMSRDMEMRCDEAVLSGSRGIAKAYSMSLLSFASDRRFPVPFTPAFGEGDVETRIRHILGWKKPKLWISVLAGTLAAAAVISCATNPLKTDAASPPEEEEAENRDASPDAASQPQKEETENGEASPDPAAARSLAPLPDGDWTPLSVGSEKESVLTSTGGWQTDTLRAAGLSFELSGRWNGWYREGGVLCQTALILSPYAEESFRWTASFGGDARDWRGTYRIGEDGLLYAQFGTATEEAKTYEAVFRVRYDAGHAYGTEYRETVGVTLVSSTAPGFEEWIGRELPMTGAAWFRGDLDGDPADAIRKMTPSDGAAALYGDAAAYEFTADRLAYGEALTALYPSSYDENGDFRYDPEASPVPDAIAVSVSDLGDLCLYAENEGRRSGEDYDSFILTSFRWRGERYELDRPLYFGPYRFVLSRGDDFAFFTVWAPSGQGADVVWYFLTEDGAYCYDTAEAGAGYQLRLWAGEETTGYLRTNADFLNLQSIDEYLRFRGREDAPYTESGTLRYEGDGHFVFAPEKRLTGSEWFEEQKKTYPSSYPEEVFGSMNLSEYLSDFLPRELRDSTLRAKELWTPEEAETIAHHLIDSMSSRRWPDGDIAFGLTEVQGFLMRLGMTERDAEAHPFPEILSALRAEWQDGEGISRANAYRVAEEMFGVLPDEPGDLASDLFRYDEAGDRYRIEPTGLSHGYFTMEDAQTDWDGVSVTVRFRLVTYVPDVPDGVGESAGIYAGERIDFGEYRMRFYKPTGLYTRELPRIFFEKCGETEGENVPEPPVGDEARDAIVYPDFFDAEQRELYARAKLFFPAVYGPDASYIDTFAPRGDGMPVPSAYAYPPVTVYDPERGAELEYYPSQGRYENWADFDAAGRSLFTDGFWESLVGPGKKVMEYGGKTYFLAADAGTNGHDPSRDRFELLEKTDERIVYRYITFYLDRRTLAVGSAERVTVTMVKTADGWRFDSFRNGNWLPAGGDAEKTTVHVHTTEEAESLVHILVREVMDDAWLAGESAYSLEDARNLTHALRWDLYDEAFPFREAEATFDGMNWGIHADQIRDAVGEVFGIRNFDYLAATREIYGESDSALASMDGLGWLTFPLEIDYRTTKYDISELVSNQDGEVIRVYAHIVNAVDFPWDEADYGVYCFTFAPSFDGPALRVEKVRDFIPRSYRMTDAVRVYADDGSPFIDVDIKEFVSDSPHRDEINRVIRDDFTELYDGYMERLARFPYDFFRLKIATEFCERDGVLCIAVRAEVPGTYIRADRIANIFYDTRTDSLLTREEFAAREGIDLASVVRQLEAQYPSPFGEQTFSYEIVGLRPRAVGEIGFYVDRTYLLNGEEDARETLLYRADSLTPAENPDTAFLLFPPAGAEKTASSVEELSSLGLDETDARLSYIRAFVTGDIDRLEEVCGVEKGMYADYRTLMLSDWVAWIEPDERGRPVGPLRFAFVPARSDVDAFPTKTRIGGTVYEGLMGAFFERDDLPVSRGEAADVLYSLLSRCILLDIPTTDEMDPSVRFMLSCYICGKLGNTDLTEENFRNYARIHFGIENFTPDGAHLGQHMGHGGSIQILDIIGIDEKNGETLVTVQYYADDSKTVKSHVWRYAMKRVGDEWVFSGSEEIRHAEYDRVRYSM